MYIISRWFQIFLFSPLFGEDYFYFHPYLGRIPIFFIFTPIWGRFPFWLIFFRWVVQPPTRYISWKKTDLFLNLDWTFKGLLFVKAKFDGLALAFPIYKAFQDRCIWEAEGWMALPHYPPAAKKKVLTPKLGAGNSNILWFSPRKLGKWFQFDWYLSNELKPPTSQVFFCLVDDFLPQLV